MAVCGGRGKRERRRQREKERKTKLNKWDSVLSIVTALWIGWWRNCALFLSISKRLFSMAYRLAVGPQSFLKHTGILGGKWY
jgi:hypothetical protein